MTQQEILDYNKRCAEFMYPYAKAEYESGVIAIVMNFIQEKFVKNIYTNESKIR